VKISKYMFVALVSVQMLGCAQGLRHSNRSSSRPRMNPAAWGRSDEDKDSQRANLRRLESVTWDSVKHELKWEVSSGEKKGDGYQPHSSDRYAINMDEATMTVNGQSRRFSGDEAENVRTLMDFVSKYAVESTVWWENGQGEPVDGDNLPTKPEKDKPVIRPQEKGRVKATRVVALQVPAE
jgi:hypothetical protein